MRVLDMAKGLPKSIIKKYGISKKAWAVFRGKKRSRGSNPKTRTKTQKRRGFSLAKKRRRRSNGMTIPIAPIAGFIPMIIRPVQNLMAGNIDMAFATFTYDTIGYDLPNKKWDAMKMVQNITPLIIGGLVHKYVGGKPLNINAALARAGVPFVRI